MSEREPKNQRELVPYDALIYGIGGGILTGVVVGYFLGQQAGVDAGVGMAGYETGLLAGLISNEAAEKLVKQGKRFQRIALRAQAFLQISTGYGIAGGVLTTALFGEPLFGVAIGGLLGGITDIAIAHVSLSQGNKNATPNSSEPK